MRRHPIAQVIVLTIVGTIIGAAIVLSVPWLPDEASAEAGPTDTLYDVLAVMSAFVFALVMAILIVSVFHYRRRYGDEGDGDPIHGNTRIEIVWTAIPAIIVLGAGVYSGVVLADIEQERPDTRTINVTAEQFAWTFNYGERGLERVGELHLVKDTSYLFRLRAKDVIHSFWVPEFRLKKDAVPGMTTTVRVKPTRRGTYSLVCVELCGLGHSTMRGTVKVEDQASFDQWVAERKEAAPPAPAGGAGGAGGGAGAQGGGA
jgi:cytochrome c oxidase subunit 2